MNVSNIRSELDLISELNHREKLFKKSIGKIKRITSLNKHLAETEHQNQVGSSTTKGRKVKLMKSIKIPVHKYLDTGLVKNSVQFKNEIFSPFREKRKEIKRKEQYAGRKITPTITDFEIGLLDEFINSRFGLKKKVTSYDMLLFKATLARKEKEQKEQQLNRESKLSLLDNSYMSDRNSYLIDYSKAIKNNAKEIVDHIAENPRFQRINLNESQTINSIGINTNKSLPRVKSRIKDLNSNPNFDIKKCNEIMKLASDRILDASMDS
jgi:hypothetical protein